MSLQLKTHCQKAILKIDARLNQIKNNFKAKKVFHIERIVNHLSNDFKFLSEELKIVWDQLFYLQRQTRQKDKLISNYQQQIENKEFQKIRVTQMMKSKCNRLSKELNFIQFSNKNLILNQKNEQNIQRSKSDYLKSKLDQLKKEVSQTNNRVCFKVAEIKNKIQNQERYLTQEFKPKSLNQFFQLQISDINVEPSLSPMKITKVIKLDDSPHIKTAKKQWMQQKKQQKQIEKSSSKKNQLAAIISQQHKVQANKEQYLSTHI